MHSGVSLSLEEARRFLLLRHGLYGAKRFHGKAGVLDVVRSLGCIQQDPLDICGTNPELVLQSRVEGFEKTMLWELLYEERSLLDHFDKNLAIYPREDWPKLARLRASLNQREDTQRLLAERGEEYLTRVKVLGQASSAQMNCRETGTGDWGRRVQISTMVLEALYHQGDLLLHHKEGKRKIYACPEDLLPTELLRRPDPFPQGEGYTKWRVKRRIASVGLLWCRPSDAFLMIRNLTGTGRREAFQSLLQDGDICAVSVEGVKDPLYLVREHLPFLEDVKAGVLQPQRCEFLAPLDNLLWDRKLIAALFGFDYKWEVYTPLAQRKYGHYVIPVLWGTTFMGRLEAVVERKTQTLYLRNLWLEPDVVMTKELEEKMREAAERFSLFNGCTAVDETGLRSPKVRVT